MKKLLATSALMFMLLIPLFGISIAHAQNPYDGLGAVGQVLGKTGAQTQNDTLHAESSVEDGASEITSTILYLADYIKYFVGGIAVIMIIYAGARLIIAGKDSEKEAEASKKTIGYAILAIVVIILADTLVRKVFFGEYGEAFRNQGSAEFFAQEGADQIRGLYNFAEYFVGAIAILMIIINGVRIAMSFGNEDGKKKAIQRIAWSLAGLVLVGVSEFVVKDILFPETGTRLPAIDKATTLLKGMTNFASAFIATAAFVMLLYAGYMYVVGGADPDSAGKAKKALVAAIVGLVLAAGSYAIVNTVFSISN
ncbi:MAG: hypothetical protein US89_C0005G0104 [Candidatus Peregrinibacteria bacterium GW2011_GWF2_38_29]|nr:MAG: hypothetical protein US89_C0005G0104 [Candidatus Peregrinibacteria bacterium GW2011_GWF2_38_29]HBB02691.1 hypothetical protein [Candidatus Peregrinibacteria bacterium]